MENKSISNFKKVKETVEIPIYSNIKLVNGKIIAKVDGTIETPVDWIEDDLKGR